MKTLLDKLMKPLIASLLELGPVKAAFSRKATITLVAVGCVYAWTKEAMAEGWPVWVTCVGMIAVAIVAAAFVLAQGGVDKEEAKQEGELMKDLGRLGKNGQGGFVQAALNYQLAFWSLVAGCLGLAIILFIGSSGCREADDEQGFVEFVPTKYEDSVGCFGDSVTQVPQLWGIYQVTDETFNDYFTTEIRIVGDKCTPVTEFREVVGQVKEVTIGENCVRQVLDMEPNLDTDCLEITGGAQDDMDVYVYPLLWYPLELKRESFPPKSAGTKMFNLVRNEVPSIIGQDQKIYPDCEPFAKNCRELSLDCDLLLSCCNDPTVRRNQAVSTCLTVMQ